MNHNFVFNKTSSVRKCVVQILGKRDLKNNKDAINAIIEGLNDIHM